MQSKRKRILTMLENGTITTDEALTLLENLSGAQEEKTNTNTPKFEEEKTQQAEENPSTQQDKTSMQEQDKTSEKSQDTMSKKEQDQTDNRKQDQTDNRKQDQTADQKQDQTFEKEQDKTGSSQKAEPSADEFLEDLRKDFSNVGDRFMHFMQNAVQKVKEFDFDSPFGKSTTFNQTLTQRADEIEEIILDIAHGKVTIHPGDEKEARAEFFVKALNSDSEETAKKEFLDKMLFVTDGEKLRVSSDMKLTQVNIDLYVPRKKYKKVSARLMNGSFKMNHAEVDSIRIKAANGKINASQLTCKDAEFETANGAIRLNGVTGETIQAETLNGRIYIDGHLKEVEAQSLNGHVIVTTTNREAEKIDAKTISGAVEIYIPADISLSGEITSNIGRLDLQLSDVDRTAEHEQLLQRTISFKKAEADSNSQLHIFGEAKTGSVLVCYNAKHE